MGEVYRARDPRIGRDVAIKVLQEYFARDKERLERFELEARAAGALNHPNLLIYDVGSWDSSPYIVCELLEGEPLSQRLRGGALPVRKAIDMAVQIARGLAAAHERGIVHRDLKPDNLFVTKDGRVKILDFGLARSSGRVDAPTSTRLTEVGSALGTPGYMAPEQLSGAEIDARADIFAFGVMAWELATGEHPFGTDAASVLARMTELIEGRTTGLSRALPLPGLDRIARRCMRATPAERYASSAALLTDLRALDVASDVRPQMVRHDGLWWWQFHQNVVAIVNAAAPAAVFAIRQWMEKPRGSMIFLVSLTLATISVTLRLNLSFTSRVHPAMLFDHRARVFPAVATVDALLAGSLLVSAYFIAVKDHDGIAAILVALAAVMLASLALIEPATTAAAGLTRPAAERK